MAWIPGAISFQYLAVHRSLRQPDSAQKLGEPGIGAQRVPECLNLNVGETIESLLAGFFEPHERLISVFQTRMDEGEGKGPS
jgi:hypothetical protein